MGIRQRKLAIDSFAWAKMQWFIQKAGDLEVSGFGITEKENPLWIVDFQTIHQENTGATTHLDDMALAKYVGENAKKGIDPCCCMRIWIHSHPFSTTIPSPSPQDTSTLHEKLLDGTDWAVMMILGGGERYLAELHSMLKMPGRTRFVVIPLYVEIDWMSMIWVEKEKDWEKEYKKNITRPKPVKITQANTGTGEWSPDGKKLRKWVHSKTALTVPEYLKALREGFTYSEIVRWGRIVLDFGPVQLRSAETNVVGGKHGKKYRQTMASRASMGLKEQE